MKTKRWIRNNWINRQAVPAAGVIEKVWKKHARLPILSSREPNERQEMMRGSAPFPPFGKIVSVVAMGLFLVLLAGCGKSPQASHTADSPANTSDNRAGQTSPQSEHATPNQSAAIKALASSNDSRQLERWEASYVGSDKIGYIHTLVDSVEKNGQTVFVMSQQSQFAIKRFTNSVMRMNIGLETAELQDGRLHSVSARARISNQDIQCQGRRLDNHRFEVKVFTPNETSQIIPWSDEVLGPFAHERLLREKPLKPGESRAFQMFMPIQNVVVVCQLQARVKEKTPLRDGSVHELLAIDLKQTVQPAGTELPTTRLWSNERGEIVKQAFPIDEKVTITSYLVTRAVALDESTGHGVDLGLQTLLRVDVPIAKPHQAQSVRYRLEFADDKAAAQIVPASYQEILERAGQRVRIRITQRAPDRHPAQPEPAPAEEFLLPNGFIQSDDREIVATAKTTIGHEKDPWKQAVLLERWVDQHMTNRDFSIGFASAGEVIKTRQGDCTEHAVLLAALCRAVAIPARVAMGLVYIQGDQVFAYHMWTEVYVGNAWYPIDGTIGQGYTGGGHIKLADASLKGVSAMSTFLPIFAVMGKLRIHVEAVED